MDHRVSRESFTAWNEEMAKRHDPDLYHTQSPLPVRLLERRRVALLLKLLASQPGMRVLEVGCGAGNVLEQVEGARVGIDLSTFLLEKARARLGSKADLHLMDAENLTFEDASFDRVYCTEVLEHVLEPRRVIAEMRRVLKPDGVAVVSVPNESLINRVKGAAFKVPGVRWAVERSGYEMADHMEDEWHLHEFDHDLLKSVVAGMFRITALRGVPSRLIPVRFVAQLSPR